MNISFIGLGKLGLCSAACFAATGHRVIGVDSNAALVAAIKAGQCPIAETGLPELLAQALPNLETTVDYDRAIRESDVTMIIVPTPSLPSGAFDNSLVENVLERMAPALRSKTDYHSIVVVSTVMPGSTTEQFIPLLEKLTGKHCGTDFGFAYNPEFIALGSVIHNFLHPDMVLIGTADERTADRLSNLYRSTVLTKPMYAVMKPINAEITKLALNCFVTMKISFANELAALCETLPNADVDIITTAIGADTRVGGKYLSGGLGFGGPCFPRDNEAFQAVGGPGGYRVQISPQVVAVNKAIPRRLFDIITAAIPAGGVVALFGLAYKANTHIVEESQGVQLARLLLEAGYNVRLHDPAALDEAVQALSGSAYACPLPEDAVRGAHALALLAAWPQFATYDWSVLESLLVPGALILDSWRSLCRRTWNYARYQALGIGSVR